MPCLAAPENLYADSANPQWGRLLDVLQMNVPYARSEGVELWRADRRRVLDFLSGYCVHNTGQLAGA
jgi:ornithine--oxo-acid transaminase